VLDREDERRVYGPTRRRSTPARRRESCCPDDGRGRRDSSRGGRAQRPGRRAGAGTGLSGGASRARAECCSDGAQNRIVRLDPAERRAASSRECQRASHRGRGGARTALRTRSASQAASTSGNVAENSGATHTAARVTTNHVLGLELVTSDRTIHRIATTRSSLVVGSEGSSGSSPRSTSARAVPQSVRTFLASFRAREDAGQRRGGHRAGRRPAALN